MTSSAASLDPFGLGSAGVRVATRVASLGLGLTAEALRRARPSDPRRPMLSAGLGPPTLEHLLRASLRQTPEQGRRDFYRRLLRELAPDEARLLAALSDEAPRPMISVRSPGRRGGVVLEHISDVGREATVSVPALTPAYVRRLIALGLAEPGPRQGNLLERYEILLAEPEVRAALSASPRIGPLGARVERGTLRISSLGLDLWQFAVGASDAA